MARNLQEVICLDAEFANAEGGAASARYGQELLELSVFGFDGTEVYRSRFKPARHKVWNLVPHGITPQMVASAPGVKECLGTIQEVMDAAKYIVGFALENDLRELKAAGVRGLDAKHVIEVKHWFWIVYGLDHGLDLFNGIGLERCCEQLGIEFDEEVRHSASGDTEATLRCFRKLYDAFVEADEECDATTPFAKVVERFESVYGPRKREYDRMQAAGYAYLTPRGEGLYRLDVVQKRRNVAPDSGVVEISVENRKLAERELRSKLARRMSRPGLYALKHSDFDMFSAYRAPFSDDYDADEARLDKALSRLMLSQAQNRQRR